MTVLQRHDNGSGRWFERTSSLLVASRSGIGPQPISGNFSGSGTSARMESRDVAGPLVRIEAASGDGAGALGGMRFGIIDAVEIP
jgi:hypothetical protein